MWLYRLRLDSGEDLYFDIIEEARVDRMEYGGTIFDRTGKVILNVSRETLWNMGRVKE